MTTLIIGGGLSGLALADLLERQGNDYLLLEARDRFGGRVETMNHNGANFDMGPAWFWSGQPRIAALIQRFGLNVFPQYTTGDMLFEDAQGCVQRYRGMSAMGGSMRLSGGLAQLIAALEAVIPETRKRLDAQVSILTRQQNCITATLASGETITASRAIVAMPPRIAAEIEFSPPLPARVQGMMQAVPTWMAGQAKAVAVYKTAFWREAGQSGDATSRHGPMVEIHDASPAAGGPFALFGFIGLPPEGRRDLTLLHQKLLAQLVRLFGSEAAAPLELRVKDWAFDPLTATAADHAPLLAHPSYGTPQALRDLWDRTLHFAGSEVASDFGGYLEGALEAAENVLTSLSKPAQD